MGRRATLTGLGFALLESGDAGAAAAIFALNVDAFPWSADAHDSLADGLLAVGDTTGARAALCRAFRIDRDYDRFFDLAMADQVPACLGG